VSLPKNLPTSNATIFIPLREVERRVSKSRWWIREQITAGRFPLPVMLGDRPSWVESEIEGYQQNLIANRSSEPPGRTIGVKRAATPRKQAPSNQSAHGRSEGGQK
jgi:predicted DNA-binding transcriptional regulator AlpA